MTKFWWLEDIVNYIWFISYLCCIVFRSFSVGSWYKIIIHHWAIPFFCRGKYAFFEILHILRFFNFYTNFKEKYPKRPWDLFHQIHSWYSFIYLLLYKEIKFVESMTFFTSWCLQIGNFSKITKILFSDITIILLIFLRKTLPASV